MKVIDNIVIGELVEGLTLEHMGVLPNETTLHITEEKAHEFNLFLPRILVHLGIFPTTSQIKQVQKQRDKSTKIIDPDERVLWRTIARPELTHFKIGKKVFWLIVGDLDSFKIN